MYAHNTHRSGPDKDVPVIVASLANFQNELDDWHEASDEEVLAYEAYWDSDDDNEVELRFMRATEGRS